MRARSESKNAAQLRYKEEFLGATDETASRLKRKKRTYAGAESNINVLFNKDLLSRPLFILEGRVQG